MNDDDAARIEYAKGMRIKANAPAAAWGCLLPLLLPLLLLMLLLMLL